jgi:hypothetical protein
MDVRREPGELLWLLEGTAKLRHKLRLNNLEHLVDRSLGQPVPDANSDDAIEAVLFLRRRFEKWSDAQVIVRRLDNLAAGNAVQQLLRVWRMP